MKLFTFEKGTTMTDALARCGVNAENRADASAWSWDAPGRSVISWHHDSPGIWPQAKGSIEGGNYEFPLYVHDNPALPIQEKRRLNLAMRIAKAASAKQNVILLRVNWKRKGPGATDLFTKEQLMYPHDAWSVGVEWADLRDSRTADGERVIVAAVVRFRDPFPQVSIDWSDLGDSASCPDSDPVVRDPAVCRNCGYLEGECKCA